jgi:putative glycosyltransferase (TIGR04348 family)
MKVLLVTPAPRGSRKGNRITALRWAKILRDLGHRIAVASEYTDQRADVLVALHAGKSAASVLRWHERRPGSPLIVALTGTDLYGDIDPGSEARRSLLLADRLIVLQPLGIEALPAEVRERARVIYQSVPPLDFHVAPQADHFDVCVMGHLRPVKDPFRTAEAARLLPASSRVRIVHLGSALSDDMAERARAEQASNPRYRWLGERPRRTALRILARCRLLSLTSVSEGGANVISEAVTVGVPVAASRIAGSIGLLGADYPGYFPVGDTQALADLLHRAETDLAFYDDLQRRCAALKPLFTPEGERQRWQAVLDEIIPPDRST